MFRNSDRIVASIAPPMKRYVKQREQKQLEREPHVIHDGVSAKNMGLTRQLVGGKRNRA
jgi:hypothetical protein